MLSLCCCSVSSFHFLPSVIVHYFSEIFRTFCLWTLKWALWQYLLKNLNTTIPWFSEKSSLLWKTTADVKNMILTVFQGNSLSLYQSHLYQLQETWGQSLGWEDCPKEGMATHSSIHAWIPWTGRLQSIVLQSQTHWNNWAHTHLFNPEGA